MKMKIKKETMASPPVADLVEMLVPIRMVPQSPVAYLFDNELYEFAYDATHSNVCFYPIPAISNQGRFNSYHPQQKIHQQFLAECYLLQDTWFSDPN